MLKHILVPVDLSDRHQQALEVAARLARESHGEVTLLHVIEITPGTWAQEPDFMKRIAELAHNHLTSLGRSLEADQALGRKEGSSTAIEPMKSCATRWRRAAI